MTFPIEVLDVLECKCGPALAEIIRPALSFPAVFYRQGQYKKIRKEYDKSTMTKGDNGYFFWSGLLPRVREFCKEKEVPISVSGYSETISYSTPKLRTLSLREEQLRLVTTALEKQRGVLVAPTATGKTAMAMAIISAFIKGNSKVIWLCHTKDLMYQAGGVAEKELGIRVGYFGDGSKNDTRRITMATRQSFVNISADVGWEYDVLIVDECFHKETKVESISGPIEIKDLQSGNLVYTENGVNKIKRIIKNRVPINRITKVELSNGKKIYVSKEHLFKTETGWIEIQNHPHDFLVDITSNKLYMMDNIMYKKKEVYNESNIQAKHSFKRMFFQKVSCMWRRFYFQLKTLLKGMSILRSKEEVNKLGNNDTNQQLSKRDNFRTNEKEQPFSYSRSDRKREIYKENKWNPSLGRKKRRKWNWSFPIRTFVARCFGQYVGEQFACNNISQSPKKEKKATGISYALQSRRGERKTKSGNRSGRRKPLLAWKERTRPKEGEKTNRIRVESIEVYKQGSNDKSFEGVIGDKERDQGFVEFYDLEVENEHNYFVEGVLVHNCHHISSFSGQYAEILQSVLAPVRIGLTATMPKNKEAELAVEAFVGPIIDKVSIEEGQERGIMADIKIKFLKVPISSQIRELRKYSDVYDAGVVNRPAQHVLVVAKAKEHIAKNDSVLIIVNRIDHGDNLLNECNRQKVKAFFARGSTEGAVRLQLKDALNNKKIHCVIATTIWKEGINIPELNVIINAAGGKSEIATLQTIGRGLRITATKKELILYDIMCLDHPYLIAHLGERLAIYSEMGWL